MGTTADRIEQHHPTPIQNRRNTLCQSQSINRLREPSSTLLVAKGLVRQRAKVMSALYIYIYTNTHTHTHIYTFTLRRSSSRYMFKVHLSVESITAIIVIIIIIIAYGCGHSSLDGLGVERRIVGRG